MTTREEKLARMKQQIAKVRGEMEHGDHTAVENASADWFDLVVDYLGTKWSELAAEAEQQQERFVASLSEQKPEAPTKIKRMDKK